MDTKLRKTHSKLKVILILLTIIVPAVVMVGFYPRLERLANKEVEKNSFHEPVWYVRANFVMDAVAYITNEYASYLNYEDKITDDEFNRINDDVGVSSGRMIESELVRRFYMEDYEYKDVSENEFTFNLNSEAERLLEEHEYSLSYERMDELEIAGYYILEYDENGEVVRNELHTSSQFEAWYFDIDDMTDAVDNFNVRNTKAVFFLEYASDYVGVYEDSYYSNEHAYWDVGAPLLIIVAALFVAILALLFPFIKSLNTGNEKIFRMPAEIIIGLTVAVVWAMMGMFFVMTCTNLSLWQEELNDVREYILGYRVTGELVYNVLIVANVIAWILCFFAEYIVVTAVRCFIAHPIKYIKERSLIVRIVRKVFKWIKTRLVRCVTRTKDIIETLKPNKLLVMILAVNLGVAIIACIFWVGGIPLFIIYTVAAYLLVYKKYMKAKEQFDIIRDSVHKMAEGDFNIRIDEDLGVFQPITDEIVKIKDGFEKALIEEAKSRDMKTELITNVSHDLKTPLTAIITYVDLLKKEDITDEERQQYIATLDMKSQRLKVLIEDLFEVSKANSGNVQMNIMDVDVVGLLKQVRLELEDKIAESNVDFRWSLPDEKIILQLDGQKTYRIFANLINNIVKYSLSGSRAFVEVAVNGSKVIVTFKNISATEISCDASNLTERFVRGDASRNSEGSGLGLAIVKSFVELQGGRFNIEVDGDLFKAVIEWSK